MGMCESDSPEVKASCLHTTTEAHVFFFHHPQRGRISILHFFSLIMLLDVSLFISAFRLLFLAFWYLMSRWPNWGGLKPLLIKFQAGWPPRESGWMWSQAAWCPPSTATSWEKVDLPEGPCDLPWDAGWPCPCWPCDLSPVEGPQEFWGFTVTGEALGTMLLSHKALGNC